jgi:hypothetical protein
MCPMAVFDDPIVLRLRASNPFEVLLLPMVVLKRVRYPIAVFQLPVLFDAGVDPFNAS